MTGKKHSFLSTENFLGFNFKLKTEFKLTAIITHEVYDGNHAQDNILELIY